MTCTTPEREKVSYLKKFGQIHLAKEAVDLEDHREVLAINRAKLKHDMKLTNGPDGPTVEAYEVGVEMDEMRIGDEVHHHHYPPQQKEEKQQPLPLPTPSNSLGKLAPWLLAVAGSLGAGYLGSKLVRPALDYVNSPTVEVLAGEQE